MVFRGTANITDHTLSAPGVWRDAMTGTHGDMRHLGNAVDTSWTIRSRSTAAAP